MDGVLAINNSSLEQEKHQEVKGLPKEPQVEEWQRQNKKLT